MTLYLFKVHLQTFLSIPITQKFHILSCDTLVANERHVLHKYGVISCFLSVIVIKDEHENKSPAIREIWLVIGFLNSRNFRLAEICRQTFEVYRVGAVNEGNLRKWCRLFKEGRTTRDHTPPSLHAHYWNSSRGKFSSTLHAVPNFLQVRHLFLIFRTFLVGHILRDKRRFAGLSERVGGDLFRRRLKNPGPTTWVVP